MSSLRVELRTSEMKLRASEMSYVRSFFESGE
jgi:hypothetical protein